jgi:hypothetical protein
MARSVAAYLASRCRYAVSFLRSTAILLAPLSIVSLSIVFCSMAHAGGQTVNFSWTQIPIGCGLNDPMDGNGNVYIADFSNNRVLKETLGPAGYTQSVVASATLGGLHGPAGLARHDPSS